MSKFKSYCKFAVIWILLLGIYFNALYRICMLYFINNSGAIDSILITLLLFLMLLSVFVVSYCTFIETKKYIK